ncbi:MAG: serine/threonine-protein phosphatase [Clostridia bacterium]|nr:serine/threonine-protein phosphatase [Clostridia bacterium]
MCFLVQAVCAWDVGKVRKSNEDNFLFDGICMENPNNGLQQPLCMKGNSKDEFVLALFDGMGGENFGEVASYAAADRLKKYIESGFTGIEVENFVSELNDAVLEKQRLLLTEKMGTTFVALFSSANSVKICNIGDSRAYRFRDSQLIQLSHDHVEKRVGESNRKCGLTQYLGFNTDEFDLDPYITESNIAENDIFLLCSDGLSDMLTDEEIALILENNTEIKDCADKLINSAKENGGRDNITVIICEFSERGE